jgi:hypothetical protein
VTVNEDSSSGLKILSGCPLWENRPFLSRLDAMLDSI